MLDEKDIKILEMLKLNSRLSTQQISKKTLIPITTVHNRIKKLEKEGIITGYSIKVDYKKLNKPIFAFIFATVDYTILKSKNKTQYDLAKEIRKHPLVNHVNMLTGNYDISMAVRVKNIDELNEFVTVYLRNLNGIARTETMVSLNEVKNGLEEREKEIK